MVTIYQTVAVVVQQFFFLTQKSLTFNGEVLTKRLFVLKFQSK